MTPVTWILVVALALVLLATGLVQVAHRLDRLNLRVLAAAESLRAARAARAAAALELATSGGLDPAASLLLADAAHRAREALDDPAPHAVDQRALDHGDFDHGAFDHGAFDHGPFDHGDAAADQRVGRVARAETDLTEAIRAVAEQAPVEDAGPADAFADLNRAGLTLSIARRLYNDAAAQCTQLHAARAVRWFRLAGHSGPPATLDFDDVVPALGPAGQDPGR
jgi:hypothetical protein